MRILMSAVALACLSGVAHADNFKKGMSMQFLQDTFSEDLVLTATLLEATDSIAGTQLRFICAKGQPVTVSFQPDFIFFMQEVSADFKTPSGVLTVSFSPTKVPGFGTEAAASPEDGKKIIDMVLQSKEIAFRTERKQGKFEVVAAKETLELMDTYCRK